MVAACLATDRPGAEAGSTLVSRRTGCEGLAAARQACSLRRGAWHGDSSPRDHARRRPSVGALRPEQQQLAARQRDHRREGDPHNSCRVLSWSLGTVSVGGPSVHRGDMLLIQSGKALPLVIVESS